MMLIDRGSGVPVIVVPGMQGRWEWHAPGIDALARRCRVLTFSLDSPLDSGSQRENRPRIDCYCDSILEAMALAGITTTALCGISYGGLVAAVFAARHPERVSALILASALPPTWVPDRRASFYLRAPRLCTPMFLIASLRLFREIRCASPDWANAIRTSLRHAWNALTHMFSPTNMAMRAAQVPERDLRPEIASVTTPTLIIVGERSLDRVVPVTATLEYLRLLPHARVTTLERTGHLGSVTRPEAFAELVTSFAEPCARTTNPGRHLG